MSRERDIEKADFEDGPVKQDLEVSDHSPPSSGISNKEENTAHHGDDSEDTDSPIRGRTNSRGSQSSDGSERTLSDGAHDHQVATPHRDRSRAVSSVRSIPRELVKVPRGKRRGLFGRLTVIAEVTNPYDYPRSMKWLLTFVIAVAGAAAPIASSIILPALVDIVKDLNTTATIANLSISLYMLAMSIFPLWWSSFSETLGRRTIYLTSFTLYVIFSILGAISTNIGMFIAMRLLSGGAAASVQAVGAGTISDIWEVKERGRAMGIFYLGPLCGPLLAPIIGGVLSEGLGWRSNQYFLAILGVVILFFILFCLPETLKDRSAVAAAAESEAAASIYLENAHGQGDGSEKPTRPEMSRTTTTQSVQVKTKTYISVLRRWFVDPLHIILYLQFPAVATCVFYATVTFCALYSLNISVQDTFSRSPYGYSPIIIGVLYVPNSLGYFLTSIFGGRWVDNIMAREARKAGRYDERGRLKYRPEDRMKENAWLGCIMFPLALIMYGWTADYGVHLAAPMVANFFFGIGSMLVFAMVTTMLTEFLPRKTSNGVALNNFVRNIFSCIGSAVTEPLIRVIGNGWLFTIFGIVSMVSGALSIIAMKKYGDHWRVTMDKKIDKVMGS